MASIKTEAYLFYIKTQCIVHITLSTSVTKINLLMLHRAEVGVVLRSTKNTHMQCEHQVEFVNVKPGGIN
jgi:hypothetical protein